MAWIPQAGPQLAAIDADWIDELFFGGARGGGKSDFLLGSEEDGVLRWGPRWRGIMFRKTYDELEELMARSYEIFPDTGGVYKIMKSVEYPFSNCWYWPNGATVKMRYLEHERDADRYQGHQYTEADFDELTNYPTLTGYHKIKGCVRSPSDGMEPIPCRVRSSGNPGGKGHIEVKSYFIDVAPPRTPYTEPETGLTRMFIPSRIQDNLYLKNSKQYIAMLKSAGSEELVKAWLEGDWDVVAGAYFDCWRRDKHVIRPFNVPKHWMRFRAFDWGSARPFSVGWYAVSAGDHELIPRGALVKYREWYGARAPNVGLKMDAEEVAYGIKRKEQGEKITYGVADPSCWKVDGGPSIAERMANKKVYFHRADNQRLNGWDQMRGRLVGEDNQPMLYFFDTCVDSIRTIPLLQHHEKHLEDIDTDMEDHAADECRYACMSRPWVPAENKKVDPVWPEGMTMNEIIANHAKLNRKPSWD